jgi:hypothetical protein
MAVVAEFLVPAEEFPLAVTFDATPDATIELERLIPTVEKPLPFFWIETDDPEGVRVSIRDRSAVSDLVEIEQFDDGVLFEVVWNTSVPGVVQGIVESDLTLLSATCSSDRWRFQFRGPGGDDIVVFQEYCRDNDVVVTLHRLLTTAEFRTERAGLVTSKQRETLILALEEGYFDTPRRTSLAELGTMLGVSRQAVASRLRRGHRNLVFDTYLTDDRASGSSGEYLNE